MCTPVLIFMAIAAVAGAYQQQRAGKTASRAAQLNANIALQAAADAKRRGDAAEARVDQRTALLVGRQLSLLGASGAVIGEGTPSLLIADTVAIGELDAMTANNNALREAWGLQAQAAQFDFQSEALLSAGNTAAAVTLIGGAANITSTSLLSTK